MAPRFSVYTHKYAPSPDIIAYSPGAVKIFFYIAGNPPIWYTGIRQEGMEGYAVAWMKVGSRKIYFEEYGKGNTRAVVFISWRPGRWLTCCAGHPVLGRAGALLWRHAGLPVRAYLSGAHGRGDLRVFVVGPEPVRAVGGGFLLAVFAGSPIGGGHGKLRKNAVHCRKIREEGLIYQSFRPYLEEIGRPTLLLAAQYDPVCGENERAYFQRHAPNGTIFEFQDSGHFPHIEEPEAFTKTIVNFLDAQQIR